MECLLCKSGNTLPGKVTVTFVKKESVVIIKEVPADVCDVCRHYYLDENTTKEVLGKARVAVNKGVLVEIVNLKAS